MLHPKVLVESTSGGYLPLLAAPQAGELHDRPPHGRISQEEKPRGRHGGVRWTADKCYDQCKQKLCRAACNEESHFSPFPLPSNSVFGCPVLPQFLSLGL